LMIEKRNSIGGAWNTLNIFGFKNVENAIHYFLPNEKGVDFLINNLGTEISKTLFKYRIFKIPYFGYLHINYNNLFSKILDKKINNSLTWNSLIQIFKDKNKSFYFKYGSPDLIKKVSKILKNSSVKTKFNFEIDKIVFSQEKVTIYNNENRAFESKKIIITNGSRLRNVFNKGKKIDIVEKFQWRPSVHLLIKECNEQKVREAIFVKDPLIKYVHNVSAFAEGDFKKNKIFVVALQHEIKKTEKIYDQIFKKLVEAKICSKNSILMESKWSDIHLPTLFNEDLIKMKELIGGKRLFCLQTESFMDAIGVNSYRWKNINKNK